MVSKQNRLQLLRVFNDNVPVSAKDRIKAAELIGKRHGAWTDKKEISGNMNIDIGMGDYDEDN